MKRRSRPVGRLRRVASPPTARASARLRDPTFAPTACKTVRLRRAASPPTARASARLRKVTSAHTARVPVVRIAAQLREAAFPSADVAAELNKTIAAFSSTGQRLPRRVTGRVRPVAIGAAVRCSEAAASSWDVSARLIATELIGALPGLVGATPPDDGAAHAGEADQRY
ncbi:MAG TPA: hypothetical protein VGJ63_04770 [Micromonosporaceae bacterium]